METPKTDTQKAAWKAAMQQFDDGLCWATNGESACLLPPGHGGRHGWDTGHDAVPVPHTESMPISLCTECHEPIRRDAEGVWGHYEIATPYEPMEIG